MRTVLSIGLGLGVWALLMWAARQQPDSIVVSTAFWISFTKIVGSRVYDLFLLLAPWFIVGLTAPKRPVLLGGLAAAIASVIDSLEMASAFPQDFVPTFIVTSFGIAAIQFVYGAAGAALAYALGSANNSFKPTPLRGAA